MREGWGGAGQRGAGLRGAVRCGEVGWSAVQCFALSLSLLLL